MSLAKAKAQAQAQAQAGAHHLCPAGLVRRAWTGMPGPSHSHSRREGRVGLPALSIRKGHPADLLEFALTGPFAWFGGEPGQVGNEAAIVV